VRENNEIDHRWESDREEEEEGVCKWERGVSVVRESLRAEKEQKNYRWTVKYGGVVFVSVFCVKLSFLII